MRPNNPQDDRIRQLLLSKDVFNQLYESIEDDLPPSFHAAPNAKYSTKTITQYFVQMCAGKTSHEGISEKWKDVMDKRYVPTGACLLKRIGGSTYEETLSSCDKMLNTTLERPKSLRLFRKRVVTSSDEHDVAANIVVMDETLMTNGKPKGGTHRMIRFTTIKVVGSTAGFTVMVKPTGKKHKRAEVAGELLARMREAGIRSKLHLLDRGFFSVDVILKMIEMDQLFYMPAVKNSNVTEAIEKHAAGTGKAITQYTMTGESGSVTVTLVIVPKKDAKQDAPVKDRYLAFITNAHHTRARTLLDTIPKEYRKRWGIETGYRCAKQIRPFTCSRNPCIRIVHFYFTMILYNVWMLINWLDSGGAIGKKTYVRPPITMYRMMASFERMCVTMISNGIDSRLFFAEGIT